MHEHNSRLTDIARQLRQLILTCTTEAGSGHPTSSLSAVELMAALLFGADTNGSAFFRFDPDDPRYPNNDRLIFSKGHASPLFYALWTVAGKLRPEDLLTYRTMDSPLEGHPTRRFAYTEAATGSLGQGLGVGLGMALNAKYLDKLPYRTFVLLGDSEMSEGSQWEAVQIAARYGLGGLIGVMDVNRLGQCGETMFGHDIEAHGRRIEAFGWRTILVRDGHDFRQVLSGLEQALADGDRPTMLIARTLKGKGVALVEDKNGWHGKPLSRTQAQEALAQLGEEISGITSRLEAPERHLPEAVHPGESPEPVYEPGEQVACREAYGRALARLGSVHPEMVVLDAEVSNSTKVSCAATSSLSSAQRKQGLKVRCANIGRHPCSAEKKVENQQNDENHKQHLGNPGCCARNTRKAQDTGDDRHDQKDESPAEHVASFYLARVDGIEADIRPPDSQDTVRPPVLTMKTFLYFHVILAVFP